MKLTIGRLTGVTAGMLFLCGVAAVSGDAPAAPAGDPVDSALAAPGPADLDALIKAAVVTRLRVEREQVAAEIRQNLLYAPDDVAKAVAMLQDKPADTQRDNIRRICVSLAKVDARFRQAYEAFVAGKYDKSAVAAEKILDVNQSTYVSAAIHYIRAESLVRSGRHQEAVAAHADILANMPDRISFAAAAAASAAVTYEKMSRLLYALRMYIFCLRQYGLTLDQGEHDRMVERVEQLQEIYKDPMGSIAGKMGLVGRRLAEIDSGKQTQESQKEIVTVLEDLIKTAEENQGGGKQGSGKQQAKGKRKQGKGRGKRIGRPGSTRRPSSPAKTSALVPGVVERPTKLSKVRPTGSDTDWGRLPPRQRQKLKEIMRKTTSERYRDIIRNYRSRLAEQEE